MKRIRLNSETEFEKFCNENKLGSYVVGRSYSGKPTHYPVILIWQEFDEEDYDSINGELIYKEDLE